MMFALLPAASSSILIVMFDPGTKFNEFLVDLLVNRFDEVLPTGVALAVFALSKAEFAWLNAAADADPPAALAALKAAIAIVLDELA